MRITHRWQFLQATERIGAAQADLAAAERRVSTGRRFDRPSADPLGMNRAMHLRAVLRTKEQAAANAADGRMWIEVADARLQTVSERLQRARELAVSGASFADDAERQAIATEFAAIRDQLLDLANAEHQGRRIFGGYRTGPAVAKVAGTWTYTGDGGAVTRRIGDDEVVRVNVTADEVFGFTAGRDVFSLLDDLEAAALAGDQATLGAGIDELDTALGHVLEGLTRLGVAGRRIEAAEARQLDEMNAIRSELSRIEDVDVAEAIMDLRLRERTYQAALAVFARSGQASLVDFLR
ncbi:MAG TPA: flagellar hook-associated protein 3 [Actinobacteria bacterium]|nr:flagellar hook-associated protein 3 [Actinomycetota bacterium]